jgi:hypothetical protein
MVHKFCIGLKKLPEINENWFCDLCAWTAQNNGTLQQIKLIASIKNLYVKDMAISTLKSQKLENAIKNEQRHLEMILDKKSQQTQKASNGKNILKAISFVNENSLTNQNFEKNKQGPQIQRRGLLRQGNDIHDEKIPKRLKNWRNEKSTNVDVDEIETAPTDEKYTNNSNAGNELESPANKVGLILSVSDKKCLLCGRRGTPMLQVNGSDNSWAHLSCGYWILEASVDLLDRRVSLNEKVFKYASLKKTGAKCDYCSHRGGLIVSCYHSACRSKFHVECGRLIHCEMKFPYQLNSKQKDHIIFCHVHSKSETLRKIESAQSFERIRFRNYLKQFEESHSNGYSNLHRNSAKLLKKISKKPKIVVNLRKTIEKKRTVYSYLYSKFV